jgi:hypothetical protein
MNVQRLLNSNTGKIVISIILGFGLATLFRKVCTDKTCLTFHGPVISEADIYKHDEKCQKYVIQSTKCDTTKKIINIEQRTDVAKRNFMGII